MFSHTIWNIFFLLDSFFFFPSLDCHVVLFISMGPFPVTPVVYIYTYLFLFVYLCIYLPFISARLCLHFLYFIFNFNFNFSRDLLASFFRRFLFFCSFVFQTLIYGRLEVLFIRVFSSIYTFFSHSICALIFLHRE